MNRLGRSILCIVALCAGAAFAGEPAPTPNAAQLDFFESRIRPLLVDQCFKCHSAQAEKLKGGLRLDTRGGVFKGGESEAPAIVAGDPESSPLITAVRYEEEALRMPPKQKLSDAQIADLEAWVKMGAPYPESASSNVALKHGPMTIDQGRSFWSFVPAKEPVIPAAPSEWVRNDIDRFVVAKLAEQQLAPSPRADKRTLIRRATYDLTGLPPGADEIEAFERDPSPDALEKVIDRLLASPHYGERWGRYWLDVARYADTKGYMGEEERRYPFSYTYRDWVIRALNDDLPYDQFLIQQIAADKLDLGGDKRPLAALGFLTLGRRFIGSVPDIIDDRIDVVTRGTMALTVACARCHDHKYDPIPTADYYSLYGVFASTREPDELPLIGGPPPPQLAEYEAELAKRKAELESFTKAKHAEMLSLLRSKEQVARYLIAAQQGAGPQPLPGFEINDGTSLVPLVAKRWEDFLKSAAEGKDDVFEAWRRFVALPTSEFEAKSPAIAQEIARKPSINPLIARAIAGHAPPKSMNEVALRYATLLSRFDSERPHTDPSIESIRLILRGPGSPVAIELADLSRVLPTADQQHRNGLGRKVAELTATHPGSPARAQAVEDAPHPVTPRIFKRGNPGMPGDEVSRRFPAILSNGDRKPFTDGSGRLELARAIASKDNPLTARVMVNRAWQYHFGAGLVRTPGDFGTRGEPPTHPQLLDYLARRFVEDDKWSLKKLHKRIMISATYQQASLDSNPDARAKDPENKLLWRQNPQRLDFEAMRDSLLVASGALDRGREGRPVDILAEPFVPRRTIYAFIDRQNLPGLFRTFDFASPDATSAKRFTTSVPQQALFMMNSPFAIQQAKKLAAREEIARATDPTQRIILIYRAALSRNPSPQELALGLQFIQSESAKPPASAGGSTSAWTYGYGAIDDATQRLNSFTALPAFVENTWRGGATLPDPALGWTMLTADGGHAGNDLQHAVIRRWTAPSDCTVAIEGALSNASREGDGVRGRIITARDGPIAQWTIHHRSADTNITGVALKRGETIDFVIDCGRANDHGHDSFSWKVKIHEVPPTEPVAAAGDDAAEQWDSATDFTGPATEFAAPLNAWEKYAQVLLQSNEFAFVD